MRLLDGKRWEAVAEDVLHGLSLDEPVEEHLAGRVRALDAAWQLMPSGWMMLGRTRKDDKRRRQGGYPLLASLNV